MPRSDSALTEALLYLAVLKRIPRKSWIDVTGMAQSLEEAGYEVQKRTLQRILKAISECDELCVEVNKKSKPYGYRQRIPEGDMLVNRLKPNESLLLRLCEEHLRYQLPERIRSSLVNFFDAARNTLNEPSLGRSKEWLAKVAFVSGTVPMLPPKITERVFTAVSNALFRDEKLEVKYVNTHNEEHVAVVSPLGLVQQEQRLYLVCKFDNYDNVRHLALHRISEAKLLDGFGVERPKDFSLAKYISERHMNYSNGKKIRLELEFTSDVTARNLTETPFNKTQKIEKLEDSAWRLEAVMDDTVLIDGWIASWKEAAGFRSVKKVELDKVPEKDGEENK